MRGRAGFWILIQRAVGAIADFRVMESEISAEQTRGQGRECGLVMWVVGMACCSARKGGGFLGLHGTP